MPNEKYWNEKIRVSFKGDDDSPQSVVDAHWEEAECLAKNGLAIFDPDDGSGDLIVADARCTACGRKVS